jgi:hypothetical protein
MAAVDLRAEYSAVPGVLIQWTFPRATGEISESRSSYRKRLMFKAAAFLVVFDPSAPKRPPNEDDDIEPVGVEIFVAPG